MKLLIKIIVVAVVVVVVVVVVVAVVVTSEAPCLRSIYRRSSCYLFIKPPEKEKYMYNGSKETINTVE